MPCTAKFLIQKHHWKTRVIPPRTYSTNETNRRVTLENKLLMMKAYLRIENLQFHGINQNGEENVYQRNFFIDVAKSREEVVKIKIVDAHRLPRNFAKYRRSSSKRLCTRPHYRKIHARPPVHPQSSRQLKCGRRSRDQPRSHRQSPQQDLREDRPAAHQEISPRIFIKGTDVILSSILE